MWDDAVGMRVQRLEDCGFAPAHHMRGSARQILDRNFPDHNRQNSAARLIGSTTDESIPVPERVRKQMVLVWNRESARHVFHPLVPGFRRWRNQPSRLVQAPPCSAYRSAKLRGPCFLPRAL